MAKVSSIIFLIAFSWYSIGYCLLVRLQLRMLKDEMKWEIGQGGFKTDKLVTLKFTSKELADPELGPKWEDANEILYRGHMYDIIHQEYSNGVLYIHCIQDNEEDSLITYFVKILGERNHGAKKHRNSVRFSFGQFLVVSFVLFENSLLAQPPVFYPCKSYSLNKGFLNFFSPPPWITS